MELLQLKYFCDAAETENYSRTANKFLVPTSNISQSVKRLERELGCELFEHRSNKILLNEAGRRFYATVSQALGLLSNAKTELLERTETLGGDIKLVCMCNRRSVTLAIEQFIKEYPHVNFIIRHSADAEQDFDIFISDVCPFEYESKMLFVSEDIYVAIDRDHPLANKKDLCVSDLVRERFITMPPDSSIHKITLAACAEAGFVPNIAIQTDDPFYLRKYIEMGLGIAFFPINSWKGMFPEKVALRKVGNISRKTYAFLPKNKYIKRSVQRFLEILKKEQDK